jgi:uncharacterized protein (TIGR00369 family)
MPEPEIDKALFDAIAALFNEKIPFNRVLGVRLELLRYDHVKARLEMRNELVGNYMRGSLHGGVISSLLDVTGGLAAFMGIQQKLADSNLANKLKQFGKLGTIDLRVDYLRPGLGSHFISSGYSLRTGNKVAVTRIELHNEKEALIAVGTGSYVIA